jgi:O-antigen/teichoic acid export membrane protein
MNRLVERFGKLTAASLIVMAIGIVLFVLTIPLYAKFGIDTDIIGLIIFTIGLAICVIGIIRRRKLHGWKLIVLEILAAILLLPTLSLIVSLIYYLITGKELGS